MIIFTPQITMVLETHVKPYPFLSKLERKMESAKESGDGKGKIEGMYRKGSSQIAKKMGEEAVEMVIASENQSDKDFLAEAADVFFYYLLALHARGFGLRDVLVLLKKRFKKEKQKG